jgi:hypothetical protein
MIMPPFPTLAREAPSTCLLKELSLSLLSLLKRAQKDFLKLAGSCFNSGSLQSYEFDGR